MVERTTQTGEIDPTVEALMDWKLPEVADRPAAPKPYAEPVDDTPWEVGDSFRKQSNWSGFDGISMAEEARLNESEYEDFHAPVSATVTSSAVGQQPASMLQNCADLVGCIINRFPSGAFLIGFISLCLLWQMTADNRLAANGRLANLPGLPLGSIPLLAEPLPGTTSGAYLTKPFTTAEIDEFKQFAATELNEFVVPAAAGENTLEIFYDLPRGEWIEFKAVVTSELEIKLLYQNSSLKNMPEAKAKAAADVLTKKLDKLAKEFVIQSPPPPPGAIHVPLNPFQRQK